MSLSPDSELDRLFAQARALSAQDSGAAERFLTGHRARQTQARRRHTGWFSALLALAAAVVTGVSVLRPAAPELPSSAAYAAYQDALGEDW
ncbi:hypothetical protein DEDE109153_12700 [Deinococcus deserti]|uniref:Uncharacterized protein n=1 Tax=Deinococcus deserti (strain DSM 17065 / CIP 109153 / LMG 22923 / VCD115) TaxID=546414 RepID=C1CXQ7_DEIDV|nr:hypothetical protein [Deinococcus deserti]ACO44863.1 hypothetical protein Deide_00660 [Deinococcus deserti VCD115]